MHSHTFLFALHPWFEGFLSGVRLLSCSTVSQTLLAVLHRKETNPGRKVPGEPILYVPSPNTPEYL